MPRADVELVRLGVLEYAAKQPRFVESKADKARGARSSFTRCALAARAEINDANAGAAKSLTHSSCPRATKKACDQAHQFMPRVSCSVLRISVLASSALSSGEKITVLETRLASRESLPTRRSDESFAKPF